MSATVVALGGNALVREGERGTVAEQRANLREHCAALAPLLDGPLVVTHGNGPQVGAALLRSERAADEAPPLPLWLAVAQTQAEIGSLIGLELGALAERAVATVVTHVRVDEDDPAFAEPTKPIGPFYSREQAERLETERGWRLVEDAGRGWRRVVPSPQPRAIVELEAVRRLLDDGIVAVACGGGGIPVVERSGRLDGVDAVIDKDLTSALLADGARRAAARRSSRTCPRCCAATARRPRRRCARSRPPRPKRCCRSSPRARCGRRSRPASASCGRPAARR